MSSSCNSVEGIRAMVGQKRETNELGSRSEEKDKYRHEWRKAEDCIRTHAHGSGRDAIENVMH